MKFKLNEEKFNLLESKFILTEAEGAVDSRDDLQKLIRQLIQALDNKINGKQGQSTLLFGYDISKQKINKAVAEKIKSILTNKPFTQLGVHSEQDCLAFGDKIEELILDLFNADRHVEPAGAIKKFENAIKAITSKTKEKTVSKDQDKWTQADWKQAFADASTDIKATNALWDQYYEIRFGENADRVKQLGEAVEIEAKELGFTPELNPFINYANYLITNGYPVTKFSYAAVHNKFGETTGLKAADLAIDGVVKENGSRLLHQRNIYNFDREDLEYILNIYIWHKDKTNEIMWALFDGKDTNDATDYKEDIDNTGLKCRTIEEFKKSVDDAGLDTSVTEKFKAADVAKLNANVFSGPDGIKLAKKFVRFLINRFAGNAFASNLRKKFNVDEPDSEYTTKETEEIFIPKYLQNATIKPLSIENDIKKFIAALDLEKEFGIDEKSTTGTPTAS